MTDLTLLTSLPGAVWRHTAMLRLVLVEWLTGSGYFLQVETEIEFPWLKSLSVLKWINITICSAMQRTETSNVLTIIFDFLSPSHPWTNNFFIFCILDCFQQNQESHVLAIWVSEFWNCSLSISFKFVTSLNIFLAELGKG